MIKFVHRFRILKNVNLKLKCPLHLSEMGGFPTSLTRLEILAYVINIRPLWTILKETGQGGLPNGKRDWSQ